MSLTPLQRYQQDLQQSGFIEDAAQKVAIDKLQSLYQRLVAAEQAEQKAGSRLLGMLGLEKKRLDVTNKLAVWRKGARVYGARDYWAEKITRRLGLTARHKTIRRRMQDVETSRLK